MSADRLKSPLIIGLVSVLLVRVSVPAIVASVPVVGSVMLVAAVVVNVKEYAPAVARVLPLTRDKTAVDAVKVSPFRLVAVATPILGVVRTGDVENTNSPVPVSLLIILSNSADVVNAKSDSLFDVVARVPVVGSVSAVPAVAVKVVVNAPTVARVLLLASVNVAAAAGVVSV